MSAANIVPTGARVTPLDVAAAMTPGPRRSSASLAAPPGVAAVLVRRHLPGFLARLEEGGHSLPEFGTELRACGPSATHGARGQQGNSRTWP